MTAYAPKAAYAPFYARMLAFLAACDKPCSFNRLSATFGREVGGTLPAKNLRCRLNYLVNTGLVEVSGKHGHYLYRRSAMPVPAIELAPAVDRKTHAAKPPSTPLQIVPPARHNRLDGIYVPPRVQILRPGALDAHRVPSRGVSC